MNGIVSASNPEPPVVGQVGVEEIWVDSKLI